MHRGPGREVQMVIMAVMVPMMPMMMAAPVMMPVTMMAVMPVSMMAPIPSVIAHFDHARVRQPGQPGNHAEIGCFGGFRRLHEHTTAKSESEYYSPEHVFLLNDGTSPTYGSKRTVRVFVSAARSSTGRCRGPTQRPFGPREPGAGLCSGVPGIGGGSRPHRGAGAGGCGDEPGCAGAWGTAFCGGVGGCGCWTDPFDGGSV